MVQVLHEMIALAGQLPVQRGAGASLMSSLMLASALGARALSLFGQRQGLVQGAAGRRDAVDHAQLMQARAAPMRSPAISSSLTSCRGSACDRLQLAPPSGDSAMLLYAMTNTASSAATIRSQASASEKPAPAAAPSTAAITGLGKVRIASIQLCRPSMHLGLHLGRLLAVGLQALQVAARAKTAAFAGDHDAAHLRAAFRDAERLDAGGVHLRAQRVAVFGVAQGQDHGAALAGALEFCGMASCSLGACSDKPMAPRRRSQGLGR